MNTPQYFKAVNAVGDTVSLLCLQEDGKAIVLYPIAKKDDEGNFVGGIEVDLKQYPNFDAAYEALACPVVKANADDYNKTLFDDWKFSGSNVYRAIETEEPEEDAISEPATPELPPTEPSNEPEPAEQPAIPVGANEGDGTLSQAVDDGSEPNGSADENGEPASADPIEGAGTPETEPATIGGGSDQDDVKI